MTRPASCQALERLLLSGLFSPDLLHGLLDLCLDDLGRSVLILLFHRINLGKEASLPSLLLHVLPDGNDGSHRLSCPFHDELIAVTKDFVENPAQVSPGLQSIDSFCHCRRLAAWASVHQLYQESPKYAFSQ
jgi:hypothetical protein